MTLQQFQEEWLPRIESALQNSVNAFEFGDSAGLQDMLRYHMGWLQNESEPSARGKRLRPLITLLSTGAFGQPPDKAMPGAAAIELLHNFTLIHDDIEDESPLRHGRPTLWKKWGIAQAINAGDALFAIAQLAMLSLVNTSGQYIVLDAIREFNRVCLQLTKGQFLDISAESASQVSTDTYLSMINGKTAALLGFASSLGALVSGQPAHVYAQMTEFGQSLGMAFQIQDDIIGIWGDPEVTGKSAASDLLSKKKTLPVLFGLSKCEAFQVLWAEEPTSDTDVKQMANLLEECGAKAYAEGEAKQYTEMAFSLLASVFSQPNEYSEALLEITQTLTFRQS